MVSTHCSIRINATISGNAYSINTYSFLILNYLSFVFLPYVIVFFRLNEVNDKKDAKLLKESSEKTAKNVVKQSAKFELSYDPPC